MRSDSAARGSPATFEVGPVVDEPVVFGAGRILASSAAMVGSGVDVWPLLAATAKRFTACTRAGHG